MNAPVITTTKPLSTKEMEEIADRNVTNAKAIAKTYGDDTSNWTGKPIEIYPTQVEFKGDLVDGIRVRVADVEPSAAAPEQPVAEAAPMADAELDDEIPW